MNIARKNENLFIENTLNIDEIAVHKNHLYKKNMTWWIFKDGSALGKDNNNVIYLCDNYSLNIK